VKAPCRVHRRRLKHRTVPALSVFTIIAIGKSLTIFLSDQYAQPIGRVCVESYGASLDAVMRLAPHLLSELSQIRRSEPMDD
jgi:hypothetical protein